MYRIIICDDDAGFLAPFSNTLKKLLANIMPKEIAFEVGPSFESGNDALNYIKNTKVDAIFLDIDMPSFTGFDLAKILCRDYKNVLVVFMSAYDNFVYEAFDYLPFAYLRKECIAEELPKVSKRIRDKLIEPIRTIVLPAKDKDVKVDVKDILYFESVKNYYIAHTVTGEDYVCRGTLSKLEDSLKGLDFFRVHSAFIVNLEHTERVTEDASLIIKDARIPISQKRTKGFRKAFAEYERRSMGI